MKSLITSSKMALTALIAAVGAWMSDSDYREARRHGRIGPAPRGWRNPLRVVFSTNKYSPHQGARECARRIGGATSAAHKAGDRARRSLPVEA